MNTLRAHVLRARPLPYCTVHTSILIPMAFLNGGSGVCNILWCLWQTSDTTKAENGILHCTYVPTASYILHQKWSIFTVTCWICWLQTSQSTMYFYYSLPLFVGPPRRERTKYCVPLDSPKVSQFSVSQNPRLK